MSTRPRRYPANSLYTLSLFARVDLGSAAAAGAVCAGLFVALATAVLILKGAQGSYPVGGNLRSLSLFWPGYSVTWPGVAIGAGYGAITGAFGAVLLAMMWNLAHLVMLGVALVRRSWLDRE